MTKEIPLTKGYVALVDDEDYDAVMSAGSWNARTDKRTAYARRSVWADGRDRNIFLHTFLTGWSRVDHRNGNGLDNRRSNLRPATNVENQRNRGLQSNNASGFKGVSWHKGRGRWQAYIYTDGRKSHLGYFPTAEAAALAYDSAAREFFGEYAALNFPGPGERLADRGPLLDLGGAS